MIELESIPGDIVEIGVYLGGSMMAMMLAYEATKKLPRTFHMYDTFQGMTEASEYDTDNRGRTAEDCMKRDPSVKCVAYLENVQDNIRRNTKIVPKYHVGDILKNTYVPEKIAVLRLDTDWYESTKHELATFYENVVSGGFVIIDDYGFWSTILTFRFRRSIIPASIFESHSVMCLKFCGGNIISRRKISRFIVRRQNHGPTRL
jgi:hypothetical protein